MAGKEAGLSAESPMLFIATTLKVYGVPFVRPVNTNVLDVDAGDGSVPTNAAPEYAFTLYVKLAPGMPALVGATAAQLKFTTVLPTVPIVGADGVAGFDVKYVKGIGLSAADAADTPATTVNLY